MSNSNLEKIQARIKETQSQIDALNSGTLDDLKDRASRRAALIEEMHLLQQTADAEREKLQQAEAEKQAKERKAALKALERDISACLAEEGRLTGSVQKTLETLVAQLTALDEIYRPDAFDIPGTLTAADREELKAAIEAEADRVTLALIGAATALTRNSPRSVQTKIDGLFHAPVNRQKNPAILQTLKTLHEPRHNVSEIKPRQPAKQSNKPAIGIHQSVNLRPPERKPQPSRAVHGEFIGNDGGGNDAA